MKKFLALIAAFVLAISSIGSANVFASLDNEITFEEAENVIVKVTVYIDGIQLSSDVPAQILEDRAFVPMRAISETLGAQVEWDDATKTATAKKGETVVKITIGQCNLLKNETEVLFDAPARIVNSRTLVPLSAVAESFDCTVEWLDDRRTVRIVSSVLPLPELSESDKAVFCYLDETPISQATYDFYNSLLLQSTGVTPLQEETITLLKEIHAAKLFFEKFDTPLTVLDKDYINGSILHAKNSGLYDIYIATFNTTDAVMRAFFEDSYILTTLEDFAYPFTEEELLEFARNEYVRVKHILVKTKEEADSILEKLNDGAVFEDLAKEFSLDGMDTETGYVFTKGEMVESFEKASFELKEGEISSVESVYGFHIIKKYPLSELSDDFLLSNYSVAFFNTANSKKISSELEKLLSDIVITYA